MHGLTLAVTSGYRDPQSEYSIDTGLGYPFYKNSRHEYGDGVDFKTPAGQTDYAYIQGADWSVNIDDGIACVEPFDASDPHARVDWRTDASAENRSSVCPVTNGVSWGKP